MTAILNTFQVFKMHWTQPADEEVNSVITQQRDRQFGQPIWSKIRWFIVIKPGSNKCLCVYVVEPKSFPIYLSNAILTAYRPIVTNQGKGVKDKDNKNHHAIAYTSTNPPDPHPDELPRRGERPMRTPIRVRPDERGDKLLERSRIDYSRVYTVEQNVKAMAFGWVAETSEKDLDYDFLNVFLGEEGYAASQRRQLDDDDDDGDEEAVESESDDDDEDDDTGDTPHRPPPQAVLDPRGSQSGSQRPRLSNPPPQAVLHPQPQGQLRQMPSTQGLPPPQPDDEDGSEDDDEDDEDEDAEDGAEQSESEDDDEEDRRPAAAHQAERRRR